MVKSINAKIKPKKKQPLAACPTGKGEFKAKDKKDKLNLSELQHCKLVNKLRNLEKVG